MAAVVAPTELVRTSGGHLVELARVVGAGRRAPAGLR